MLSIEPTGRVEQKKNSASETEHMGKVSGVAKRVDFFL